MIAALADHLWQSTLFAAAIGLAIVVLRIERAGDRYRLWFLASAKFLLPFSLFAALGSHLAWTPMPLAAKAWLYFNIAAAEHLFGLPSFRPSFGWALVGVWLAGFAALGSTRALHFRRLVLQLRRATPLAQGREVEALRRAERLAGITTPAAIRSSRDFADPGIFGVFSPALLWPEGISEHLDDAHLDAIMAHEVWHIARRDNLTAALQMVIEALFWFHPLVWWMGARLLRDRERACDDKVIEWGSARTIYAESILAACRFQLRGPLSALSGADLKRRLVDIMTGRAGAPLGLGAKFVLTLGATGAIIVPALFGMLAQPPVRPCSNASPDPASWYSDAPQ